MGDAVHVAAKRNTFFILSTRQTNDDSDGLLLSQQKETELKTNTKREKKRELQ